MTHRLILPAFGLIFMLFSSCKKDEMGSVTVTIHDSGSSVAYDEIVIDVRRVEVKFANANTNNEFGKYFLDAHNRQFDLASLADSADAEIANKKRMPTGALTEMRIVAGDENYIKINGVTYDLVVSNAPNSGLTFTLDDKGIYAGQQAKIVLNIDVAASIVQNGGSFTLNPIITVE